MNSKSIGDNIVGGSLFTHPYKGLDIVLEELLPSFELGQGQRHVDLRIASYLSLSLLSFNNKFLIYQALAVL